MDWLTQQDIELEIGTAKLVELADDNRDGVADEDIVARKLDAAMRQVEGCLSLYVLPDALPWPVNVVRLGVELAVALLQQRRRATYNEVDQVLFEQIERRLVRIQKGQEVLTGLPRVSEMGQAPGLGSGTIAAAVKKPALMATGF